MVPLNPFRDNFETHPQYEAVQSLASFKDWRLSIFSDRSQCRASKSLSRLCKSISAINNSELNIHTAIENLRRINPELCVITASRNRSQKLARLALQLDEVRRQVNLAWIIIDNGSSYDSQQLLIHLSTKAAWIIPILYKYPFNYAAPARNHGLLLAQAAFYNGYKQKYVWVLDSDDEVYTGAPLRELISVLKRRQSVIMCHGFAVGKYHNLNRMPITEITIPRPTSRNFPEVLSLKDEFDAGPQLLSGIIPLSHVTWFTYPNEFTFEDDTLNQRIMLWAQKYDRKIVGIREPIMIKHFHDDSMSVQNEKLAKTKNDFQQLGPSKVYGIRAMVVRGLIFMRDYFARERL